MDRKEAFRNTLIIAMGTITSIPYIPPTFKKDVVLSEPNMTTFIAAIIFELSDSGGDFIFRYKGEEKRFTPKEIWDAL